MKEEHIHSVPLFNKRLHDQSLLKMRHLLFHPVVAVKYSFAELRAMMNDRISPLIDTLNPMLAKAL
jgi:hypothetical protein